MTSAVRQPEPADRTPSILLPYQVAWVDDAADFKVCIKSRQIGISFAEAFDAVDSRLSGRRVCDYWYSSADESAAEVFIRHCAHWLGVYQQVAEVLQSEEVFDGVRVRVLSVVIMAPLGGGRTRRVTINALTSNPTAMRSKSGDVTLDEYDWHRDQHGMMAAAQPVTMRGFRLRVISTYNGERDLHALRMIAERAGRGEKRTHDPELSLHVIDIHTAVAQGLVESVNRLSGTAYTREQFVAKLRSQCRTQAQWEQEYECKPATDETSYYPHTLTRPLVDHQAPPVRHDLAGFQADLRQHTAEAVAIAAGCDVGRHKDRFVLRVRARAGGRWRLAATLEYQAQDWTQMEAATVALMNFVSDSPHGSGRRVRRLAIDKGGIGDMLSERMVRKYGKTRVECVDFTNEVKQGLAEQMRVACEERTITLEDDPVTLGQFAAIRKSQTASGRDRYAADADEHGHQDRFWADCLAVDAGADFGRSTARAVEVVAW
jgi:phage FluMu gp28-like protein